MAYIYRYQLKKSGLRAYINLKEYSKTIQSILSEHFYLNLKDSMVEEQYFEFKLYSTVSSKYLQKMGRLLKAELPFGIHGYGFIRMEQTFYALVYKPMLNEENAIHIELIDSELLDGNKKFTERADAFFEKAMAIKSAYEKKEADNEAGIIKNYYVDILEAYVDKKILPPILNCSDEVNCFFLKGYHKRYTNKQYGEMGKKSNCILLEKGFDVAYVENKEKIRMQEDDKLDYLEIILTKEQKSKIKEISVELDLIINTAGKIEALDKIWKVENPDYYKFRVHKVGQALATSISKNNKKPFLYFDYGMPFGDNKTTRPSIVSTPTCPESTIILSHVDKDHWYRIADEPNAYRCHWFIPKQYLKVGIRHVLAEIIVRGGTAEYIRNDIPFSRGLLSCGGISKITPSRVATTVHETGLALRLNVCDTHGRELNILVSGDQMYDYIDNTLLDNLSILVASHHGGSYSWSGAGRVPNAGNPVDSIVIYSYGIGNSHGHPSTTGDYVAANWNRDHHVDIDGEYETVFY